MQSVPVFKLNSGYDIPAVGLGLWKITDQNQLEEAVLAAAQDGYRLFDSAQAYGNEEFLGNAIKKTAIPREQLFITTKISVFNMTTHKARKSFETSLQKLQTNYVDLLLLHFPVTGVRSRAWKDLEAIKTEGKALSIGVSNYTIKHLQKLLNECSVRPAVNQVELHVFLQQPQLLEFCRKEGIMVEAYSPLAHGRGLDDPVLVEIARKHSKTPAQIMIRWCIEQGTIPIPKSVTRNRIQENLAVFDFTLDADDTIKISQLGRNLRTCWDPTFIP